MVCGALSCIHCCHWHCLSKLEWVLQGALAVTGISTSLTGLFTIFFVCTKTVLCATYIMSESFLKITVDRKSQYLKECHRSNADILHRQF